MVSSIARPRRLFHTTTERKVKSIPRNETKEGERKRQVQKAASRVPSTPYNAKCHSNMSSSSSAHVANALGSVSMCASESIFLIPGCVAPRCLKRRLRGGIRRHVVVVVVAFSSRLYFSRVFRVVVVRINKAKAPFLFLFSFMKKIGNSFVSFCARAREKFTKVMSSSRSEDDEDEDGERRHRRRRRSSPSSSPREDAAEEETLPIRFFR